MSPSEKDPSMSEPMDNLEHWLADLGIAKLAATFIEMFGSLSSVLAQFLYISQPMLDTWLPANKLSSLAEYLEDEEQSAAFAARLRRGRG